MHFAVSVPHLAPIVLQLTADLMWSDPDEVDAWAVSPRGAGWLFGAKVTAEVSPSLELGRATAL